MKRNYFSMKWTSLCATILALVLITTHGVFAQTLPISICGPSGGIQADIIEVQSAYRGLNGAAPTFSIPIGAQNATVTISSHAGVISSPSTQQTVNDEDFITVTAVLDFTTNTSSGILNFARSTFTDESESNLYSWIDVPFGVNVSSQYAEGQITSPPLNDVTFTLASGVLTIAETATDIQSSYLIEYTSPNTNSLTSTGAKGLFFTGGAADLSQSTSIPANTDVIIISKKGTVRENNGSYGSGWEEGYADGRIVIDVTNSRMDGFLTVANGLDLASRSTYVIQNHGIGSTGFLTASGNVIGDYTGKTTADATPLSVGISDPAIYISGGNLNIDRQVGYATAFDDVYLFEFYERTGDPMSASFIASRSSYIARTEGTTSGTDRVIKIPTGSDYAIVRQAGNANNLNEQANENPMAGYYYINLRTEKALGYFWQQVGFGGTGSSSRRDDNYGFAAVPLSGQSTRLDATNGSISKGVYYNSDPYDLSFNLSADKSELTITNAFGLVANEYKALSLVTFYGKKIDLTATTNTGTNVYNVTNNGTCGGIEVTFTVCNPGSGNSAGGFNTAVYDKDPTIDGSAKLMYVGTFPTPIAQGDCEKNIFDLDLNALGIDDINVAIYCVLNDDGRNAAGGIGTAIGQPFSLTDLEGQNEDYIECDYSNNLITINVTNVMACPTVDFLVTNNTTPTLTGTWDSGNSLTNGLEVEVNGVNYVKGTNGELTTVGDIWTLDLSGLVTPLNITTYPVEATSINNDGTSTDGTTDELIITDAGLVMLDINGITDNSLSGPAQDTVNNQQLYVNIVHEEPFFPEIVVETSPVTNGTYVVTSTSFTNSHEYSFQLSTLPGTVGDPPPAIQLSGDFVYTAEGESGAGDGTPDGYYFIEIADANDLPAVSFGIQRKPKSGGNDIPGVVIGNVVQGTRYNPGTFGGFEMPAAAFGGTDDGNIDAVTITSISSNNSNILFLTYEGMDYYRDDADIPVGCVTCKDFDVDGPITIATTASGVLTEPIYLATIEGFVDGSVFIDYTVIDNAGFESDNATTLEVPMIALKYESGAWENGSDASGQPNQTDGDKTLFWIDNGGTLSVNAEVKNMIIYSGVDAEVEGVCLKVNNDVDDRGGKLVLTALSDEEYGQYYGPAVNASMEMEIEEGWHNVAFPFDITVEDLADLNNTVLQPNKVRVTGDIATSNIMYYNTEISGGKEYGFFINRNGSDFKAHAYGQYVPSSNADNLIDRGWNFYWDDQFVNTLPSKLYAEGTTIDVSKTYSTHNNFGGWTMIPNIYPVALSTKAIYDDGFFGDPNVNINTAFDKAVFIWNPNDPYEEFPLNPNAAIGAYIGFDPENGVTINGALSPTTDGDALIAPFQGFYIRRSNASTERRVNVDGTNVHGLASKPAVPVGESNDPDVSGSAVSVVMKPAYRSSCEITTNYKTNSKLADIVLLRVTDLQSGLIDETELAFASHYTNKLDQTFDIKKFASGGAQFPSLFSIIENQALVINKMAIPDFSKSVPLGFASSQKEHTFTIEVNQNPDSYNLYLEDLKAGLFHNLNEGPYTFKNDVNYKTNRFKLHFNNGKRAIVYNREMFAWSKEEGIQIAFEKAETSFVDVVVTNMMGQVLFSQKQVSTSELYLIPLNKNNTAEILIVSATGSQYKEAVKVFH